MFSYFSGVIYDTVHDLTVSAATVCVSNASHVRFTNCSFSHLGLWALHFANGTRDSGVFDCNFVDLSGGSIYTGNLDDTNETNPEHFTTNIQISNNVIENTGNEYHGAPGLHSFCTVDMQVSHNLIRHVPYTGISFNWPNPQTAGYSRNNRIVANDVSDFMYWGHDGGGIHVIGPTGGSLLQENYFHQSSTHTQSVIYIDNWSKDLLILNNVVDDCPQTRWLYQQMARLGAVSNISNVGGVVRNTEPSGGNPCNCTNMTFVKAGDPLPPRALTIIGRAGPTKISN